MTQTVQLPLWLFVLIVLFAAVTFASHFLFPSVRWFFRRRLEKAVARLNKRLERPIEPFKLARRYDMIQRLIYDPEVTQAIVEHARENGVPENVAFEQARRYAREIVPSFSAFAYFGFGIRVARWFANLLYDVRTGARNDAVLREVPSESTVIFIMNHRSNMDYLLVTYLAARSSALSYAVGEWARVWPLSRLIKSMGAYFIRRRSRGALYRRVLARYVQMATAGGVTQAIFPEGGLSLNGSLAAPKMGLLAYVAESWQPDGRDVAFVPVAINYDRVLEDRILVAADARGDRRFGARISVILGFIVRKLWLRARGRFLRFGSAAVVFGPPLMLSSYPAKPAMQELAGDLMDRIEGQMPLLWVPLLAHVLLGAERPLEDTELTRHVISAHESVEAPELLDSSAPDQEVALARSHLLQRGMIEDTGEGWQAASTQRDVLQFYASSVAHYFDEPARIAADAKS